MAQPALLSRGARNFHALFNIELIKRQDGYTRPRWKLPGMLCKLVYSREVWQLLWIVGQVEQGNECMSLATPIRQFQLSNGFVILAGETQNDIFCKFAQVKSGIGEGEKLIRVLVDSACFPHYYIIKVCCKDRKR